MSEGIRAAAPNVLTSDIPGVLPLPIVQPVYNNFIGRRPVIDAIGAKAMPQGGKVFIRPEVTTHTSMGVQSTENTSLTQGTFVVTDNQVTKGSYGGFVTLSEQSIDWSQPEIISLVLDDMGRIYANETDNVAADNLKTGATVTQNFAAASSQDPAYWMSWISSAAQTILSSSNGNLPTHIFVNPEWWGSLMQLSDTADRPLFPQIGPMNAFGNLAPGQVNGVAFGLQVVVDRNFAADTLIIGDASGYEIFEQQKGALSIDVPSTLSRTIAFRGYLATLMIDSSKFVKAAFV
jgi:HK97 family phage major capsid protein